MNVMGETVLHLTLKTLVRMCSVVSMTSRPARSRSSPTGGVALAYSTAAEHLTERSGHASFLTCGANARRCTDANPKSTARFDRGMQIRPAHHAGRILGPPRPE